MKTLGSFLLLLLLPGGERERGLALYRDGKYAEAAAAFRAAIEQDGDSAELQWNLALASWRAGDLAAAETAAEKYAALGKSPRTELHAGLLGAVRHDEAKALEAKADAAAGAPPAADGKPEDPLPLLEQALSKANQARDHFVRGVSASGTPELLRNTERSLRTIDELQKKIDELKKQREQQPKDDKKQDDKQDKQDKQDDKKDKQDDKKPDDKNKHDDKQDDKKQDQQKQDDKQDPKKSDDKQQGEKQGDKSPDGQPQSGQGEEKPEPKAGKPSPKDEPQHGKDEPKDGQPKEKPEPQPGEAGPKQEPKPGEQRQDAPGEAAEGRELTPEQTQRLMEQLRDLDDKQKAIRARAKSGRRPVERDW